MPEPEALVDAPALSAPPVEPKVDPTKELRTLVDAARSALQPVRTYRVHLKCQERVNGVLKPADDVQLSIRREPKAVRLEWPEGDHKGREVIYSADLGSKMFVRTPNALIPRMALPLDSPLVMSSSRHPITEAGFDTIVDRLNEDVRSLETGKLAAGNMSFDGRETPAPIGRPCDKITRRLADGETWIVYLDAESHLPALVEAHTGKGELLEHFEFLNPSLDPTELAAANCFDPDSRWGASKGLLGRMARGSAEAGAAATTTR